MAGQQGKGGGREDEGRLSEQEVTARGGVWRGAVGWGNEPLIRGEISKGKVNKTGLIVFVGKGK